MQSHARLIFIAFFKNKEFAEFVNRHFGQDAFRGASLFIDFSLKLMIGKWYTPTTGMNPFLRCLFEVDLQTRVECRPSYPSLSDIIITVSPVDLHLLVIKYDDL